MVDLMRHLNLPALLVARTSLGTINHTLLSLAALRAARLDIRGVIMVGKPNRDNTAAIENYGRVRVVGTVPPLKKMNRAVLRTIFHKHFDRRMFRA
jgi:dethiobiotin synthetase